MCLNDENPNGNTLSLILMMDKSGAVLKAERGHTGKITNNMVSYRNEKQRHIKRHKAVFYNPTAAQNIENCTKSLGC